MTDKDILEIIAAIAGRKAADGCSGCAFWKKEAWEMPCEKCKRNCKDYWRRKEGETDE